MNSGFEILYACGIPSDFDITVVRSAIKRSEAFLTSIGHRLVIINRELEALLDPPKTDQETNRFGR